MEDKFDDLDQEQDDANIVEMIDEDNNKQYFYEEMQFTVGNDRYALLNFIKDEDSDDDSDEEESTIAKIIVNADGEDEYFSPSDEEFAVALRAYEDLMID